MYNVNDPSTHSGSLLLPDLSSNNADDKLYGAIQQSFERTDDILSATLSFCSQSLILILFRSVSFVISTTRNYLRLWRQTSTPKTQSAWQNQFSTIRSDTYTIMAANKYCHWPCLNSHTQEVDQVRSLYVKREVLSADTRPSTLSRWNLWRKWISWKGKAKQYIGVDLFARGGDRHVWWWPVLVPFSWRVRRKCRISFLWCWWNSEFKEMAIQWERTRSPQLSEVFDRIPARLHSQEMMH